MHTGIECIIKHDMHQNKDISTWLDLSYIDLLKVDRRMEQVLHI